MDGPQVSRSKYLHERLCCGDRGGGIPGTGWVTTVALQIRGPVTVETLGPEPGGRTTIDEDHGEEVPGNSSDTPAVGDLV